MEDGPAEIIWQGNEIIVKKPRKKVKKGTNSGVLAIEVIVFVCVCVCCFLLCADFSFTSTSYSTFLLVSQCTLLRDSAY